MAVATPPPRKDIEPRKDVSPRPDIAPRKDLTVGSRPPPQKRPSTSSLSILFVMGLVLVSAFIASGNWVPVDPNGPGGPPTLEPYYDPQNYPVQHIVTPTGGYATGKQNLQLQTFNVDNCGDNYALLFLIDTSGSMSYANKIGNEKNALTYFTNNMGGLSAIGIDTFGGEEGDVKTQLPLNYFRDIKPQLKQIIDGLTPNGGTPTRDAMQLAYEQLKQSIDEEDYPGYQYNLVLITDGVPEILPSRSCEETTYDAKDAPLDRCFALEEDPRGAPPAGDQLKEEPAGTNPPPDAVNVGDEIKNLGVDVFTINVYSPSWPSDNYMYPYLKTLLQNIASPPSSTHYYDSINGSDLESVLQNIENNICYKNYNGS